MGVPIVLSIALAATAYCFGASFVLRKLPASAAAFWGAVVLSMFAGVWLVWRLPYRRESHHRTPLPVWGKVLAIALVTTSVVALKHQLGGFMTTFPMVGVVATYESRYSLWTIVRRISDVERHPWDQDCGV